MATPSLPGIIMERQLISGQQTINEKVAPATYAEYIAIKQHKGTATETLDTHLRAFHTQVDNAIESIETLNNDVSSVKRRLGTINKMSYGTANPPETGVVGEIYFKLSQ